MRFGLALLVLIFSTKVFWNKLLQTQFQLTLPSLTVTRTLWLHSNWGWIRVYCLQGQTRAEHQGFFFFSFFFFNFVIPRIWRAFPNNLHLKKKASNSSIKRITGKKKKKKKKKKKHTGWNACECNKGISNINIQCVPNMKLAYTIHYISACRNQLMKLYTCLCLICLARHQSIFTSQNFAHHSI